MNEINLPRLGEVDNTSEGQIDERVLLPNMLIFFSMFAKHAEFSSMFETVGKTLISYMRFSYEFITCQVLS